MGKMFFTSDLHFCHDREFVFKPRGFKTVADMENKIVDNWNNLVSSEDDVYILGDVMLNCNQRGIKLLKSLKGKIHIIIGNHDTDTRIGLYGECDNVEEVIYVTIVRYKKYSFYLSHYPTITSSLEKESLKKCIINLYGHTHQKNNFFQDIPFMYHVGVDSHNCTLVNIEQIIYDCENKVKECVKQL